jgi:phage-related protein
VAGEDEDITIDLRLRDYLTGGAATAAHEMEELATETRKAARALLLLDKRADKAAATLIKLAAAARTARGAMNEHGTAVTNLNKSMKDNIQTQRNLEKSLLGTKKKTDDANKSTKIFIKTFRLFVRVLKLAGPALAMVAKGLALIGAASVIGTATQGVLALTGALTTLLSFAALIPTALGSVAAVALTLKTAFTGVGPALKAAASGDMKALATLTKDMPKATQNWFKQLVPVLKTYKNLRKEVQGALFEALDSSIPEAIRSLQPIVRRGMKSIATEAGGLLNEIGLFFSQERGRRMFERFFMGGNQLLRALQEGIGPLMRGLSDVVESVTPAWDRLMKSLGGGIEKFGNWLSQISNDGSLEDWLDTAIGVAKNLWSVLKEVGNIIGGLVRAAGGASGGEGLLGGFGTALGEISKWVNSMEGQTALQSFFSSLGTIVQAVAPVLKTVAGIIGNTLAPTLADMAVALGPSVNQFFQALGAALQVLAPYLPPLAAAFGQLLVALTPLLPIIMQIVQMALQQLVTLLPVLVPLIAMFAQAFAAILGPALQVLLPIIQQLAPYIQLFFQIFLAVLQPLIPQLQLLGQMFAQMLQDNLSQLVAMLPTLIPLIMQLAMQFGTLLVNALTMLMPYMPQLIQLMSQAMQAGLVLAPVILRIAIVFLQVLNAGSPLLGLFLKILGIGLTMASGLVSIGQQIGNAFLRMADWVGSAVGEAINLFNRLKGVARTLASPFVSAINSITGAFGRITGAVSGAIGSIGNLIDKAKNLASIDINPFRFAGGDVKAGTKYTVGEIGPELYVPKTGKPQMIGTGGIEARSFNNDGFIVPSFMLGAFKSLERGLESVNANEPGLAAREIAAIAAASGGTTHEHYYDVDVIIQGNVKEEVDIERAVKRAIDKAERDRRERS